MNNPGLETGGIKRGRQTVFARQTISFPTQRVGEPAWPAGMWNQIFSSAEAAAKVDSTIILLAITKNQPFFAFHKNS